MQIQARTYFLLLSVCRVLLALLTVSLGLAPAQLMRRGCPSRSIAWLALLVHALCGCNLCRCRGRCCWCCWYCCRQAAALLLTHRDLLHQCSQVCKEKKLRGALGATECKVHLDVWFAQGLIKWRGCTFWFCVCVCMCACVRTRRHALTHLLAHETGSRVLFHNHSGSINCSPPWQSMRAGGVP